ncbi:MAG: hypothetical protein WAM58_20485, partial [Candidatus Acidiferrum sp.]
VLGIGVLIAAAVTIPRHFGTHADPKKAMSPSDAKSTATADNASATASSDSTGAPSKPLVSIQGDQGSLKIDANGNVSVDSPKGSMHVDAQTGAVTMSDKPAAQSNKAASGRSPIPPAAHVDAAPAVPEPPPGPSPEEIAKVEDEADKLNVRAETATQSVETLRKEQMASGYNLRADIASSEERMQLYMSKGNNALKAQDLQNAQKYFDMAEKELAKIEKFLGH